MKNWLHKKIESSLNVSEEPAAVQMRSYFGHST